MRFDRFDYTVWAVLAGLGLALAAVIFTGDQIGARVMRTLPAGDAGEVGAFGPIGIEFAQPMQAPSVESHFTLAPAVPGRFDWQGRQLWFTPLQAMTPGTTYTARLSAGALSLGGQPTKRDVAWRFTVRSPWITYVTPASAPHEIWRVPAAGGEPEQLTQTGGNVYDYAVSPDGAEIVFSVLNEGRGLDLWLVASDGANARLLVNCGQDRCSAPAWAPGGARLAYSREGAGLAPEAPNGPPRVWTVEMATGQTSQLYQDSQVLGYGPSWSPDGRRLAFFDGSVSGIRVLDLQTSEEMVLPSWMGVVGTWSPDGSQMLFNDLSVAAERPYAEVFIADFESGTVSPALGAATDQADYSIPNWSPTGEWLIVSLRLGQQTPNEQLWIMRPDGSEASAITTGANYTYGRYTWDPWGQNIVLQRLELGVPFPKPQISIWPLGGAELIPLAEDATWPAWMP